MSDRLPQVSTKLDYDEAKAEWKAAAVTDINGQYLSVCGSTYDDLEPLGAALHTPGEEEVTCLSISFGRHPRLTP